MALECVHAGCTVALSPNFLVVPAARWMGLLEDVRKTPGQG